MTTDAIDINHKSHTNYAGAYAGSRMNDTAHRLPRAQKDGDFRPFHPTENTGLIVHRKTGAVFHRAPAHGFKWANIKCGCNGCRQGRGIEKKEKAA